jgi:lycopene cyclase domain-containing protein
VSLYLCINLLTILVPLLCSFERRWVKFYQHWRFLFPSLAITALLFLVWDVWFTDKGVWGFNRRYTGNTYLFGLPLEEYLFFITVPYACVFSYACFNYLIRKDYLLRVERFISFSLLLLLITVALTHTAQAYTFYNCLFTAGFLALVRFAWRPSWLSRFYFNYLLMLIPFTIVNGLLTGSWIDEPVVWYNNNETLGIRFLTIPIEDFAYGFLLQLVNVAGMEYLKGRAEKVEI